MKRTIAVAFVALLAAVATAWAPTEAEAATTTYKATIAIANQQIGLTTLTDATNAQVTSVQYVVFLAPGEVAKASTVSTSSPNVAVKFRTQENLNKGEIHVAVKVVTSPRTLRENVSLFVAPLDGGPYTFERISGRGVTNNFVRAVYVKN